jgi:hypothetical protein
VSRLGRAIAAFFRRQFFVWARVNELFSRGLTSAETPSIQRHSILVALFITMKISSALLLFLGCATANAWVTTSSSSSSTRHSTLALMASKGAEKWEKKKAWLASRGLGEDGLPVGTTATATSADTVTIIGGGRIGSLLAQGGENTVLLGRGDTIDADGSGPILICTRNDALDGIVESCPENRRKDLVFLQNGYLDEFLSSKGLLDNTQALLYLSVTALGADPVDGVTTVNPEGLTAATGEYAQAFADLLAALNLKCNAVSAQDYRPAMFEKLM